jgi:glucosyl-dolichyl phosphate glucuronosyltransferase
MRATVIIPTFGRPASVKAAMGSLLAVDPLASDVEVLVVDNNSDEALRGDVRAACTSAGDPVRYVAEPSPGLTAARHRGAREARGDILVYIDDDVQVSAAWLRAILAAFGDEQVGIAGGPSIPLFTCSVPAWLWDFFEASPYGGWSCGWLSLLDIGKPLDSIDPVWIWGLNFAIRRNVLDRLGGFHPDLVPAPLQRWQGDGETGLSLKAKAAGVKCVYAQEALLQHVIGPDRLTPEYFARRAFYQGVCDSFTRIRAGIKPSAHARGPRRRSGGRSPWAGIASDVGARADAAYREGWAFHQREAARDPHLLAWIRRESFLDADIRRQPPAPVAPAPLPIAPPAPTTGRLRRRLHRYASAIAPKTLARMQVKDAFSPSSADPILVYQMGKVGSTTVLESLERAGLPNPIFHLHALADVGRYRDDHLAAGAGIPYHLELGEAVAAELQHALGKRCRIISLVRDPIAVQVSGLFEVPQFAHDDVRRATDGIDPQKAAERLGASLVEPGALDYVFEWFDREIKKVFGIDVFARPFPKAEGAAVFRGERADLLLLRLEDLDRVGPAAIGEFLGLGKPIKLVAANVRADKPQAQSYSQLKAHLKLDPGPCEAIYSSRFATHFYSDDEIRRFIAKWSGRGANRP